MIIRYPSILGEAGFTLRFDIHKRVEWQSNLQFSYICLLLCVSETAEG